MTDCIEFTKLYHDLKINIINWPMLKYASDVSAQNGPVPMHERSEQIEDKIAEAQINLGKMLQAVQDCHNYEVY
jgi:hypothetical protein